jgi:hypothetical protein
MSTVKELFKEKLSQEFKKAMDDNAFAWHGVSDPNYKILPPKIAKPGRSAEYFEFYEGRNVSTIVIHRPNQPVATPQLMEAVDGADLYLRAGIFSADTVPDGKGKFRTYSTDVIFPGGKYSQAVIVGKRSLPGEEIYPIRVEGTTPALLLQRLESAEWSGSLAREGP